jgi:hypothetical protein
MELKNIGVTGTVVGGRAHLNTAAKNLNNI